MAAEPSFDLRYPDGWISVAPVDGTIAVVVAPERTVGFHPNIVVTFTEVGVNVTSLSIDRYIGEVVGGFNLALTDPAIQAIWTTARNEAQQQLRLVVHHRVEEVAVELVQHHSWCDGGIVVISASIPILPTPDLDLIAMLDVCLLSASSTNQVQFIDWEPSEMPALWSPDPQAERIAHL